MVVDKMRNLDSRGSKFEAGISTIRVNASSNSILEGGLERMELLLEKRIRKVLTVLTMHLVNQLRVTYQKSKSDSLFRLIFGSVKE